MAPLKKQEGEPTSLFGIPWPFWVMVVANLMAGAVVADRITLHMSEKGHRWMEKKAAELEVRVRRNEADIMVLRDLQFNTQTVYP